MIVIDLNNNSIVGEINNQHGVHGVAFAVEVNKGYITNGKDSSVTVFDLKSLRVIKSIKLDEKNPDAIFYEPISKRIFTFNNHSASSTAIDPTTDKIIATVKLDGDPEAPVSDSNGKIYVNLEDKSAINVFDAKTLKINNYWSVAPCESPSGLAIDRKNKRLFTVGRNNLMSILNAESGKLITTVPIGNHVDGSVFDSETMLAFSSNGEGTITIIKEVSPNEFKVIDNVPTQKGARTITLDEKTHRVYTSTKLTANENSQSFGVIVVGKK
jgi:DNA-binding beta-propeller fold protein YncE